MPKLIGLDFETYGAVDLRTHGLHRYVNDVSFTPLIGSTRWMRGKQLTGVDYDFIDDRKNAVHDLRDHIGSRYIVAHNAGFEQAVLCHLGLDYPSDRFIDSAVVALVAGAGPRLEAAAPQLLGADKMEEGKDLIKLFSIPGEYQEKSGSPLFDPQVIDHHPQEWVTFKKYCGTDAEQGLLIADGFLYRLAQHELDYAAVTQEMNRTGWPVDIKMVREMHRRYLENLEVTEHEFRARCDAPDLNFASSKQLAEWCLQRGIKASSFDKSHVASLIRRITKKLDSGSAAVDKFHGYTEVLDMLQTKQALGGSSLKKLEVILNNVVKDTWHPGNHLLMDQYQHAGAGQTLRTTGRNVQMQNLKRLDDEISDMSELLDLDIEWDNDMLAANIRQVFTSRDKKGRLIVGDFSQVESRMLAFIAGEDWKVQAYIAGKKIYEMMASQIYGTPYDHVTKTERQAGKVGELSCGYGAAGPAVRAFAANMGITMSEGESLKLVSDWRNACPKTVQFWWDLDEMLHAVVGGHGVTRHKVLAGGMAVVLSQTETPESLRRQAPGVVSLRMQVIDQHSYVLLTRLFHGCHVHGRNIRYFKPSERKTGDLWRATYTDPKTKLLRHYELYGGKLTGILVQSLCREVFMQAMLRVHQWTRSTRNQCTLIGQFHDELVVDWVPGNVALSAAKAQLYTLMSNQSVINGFPLEAVIKDDYRYTK